MDIRPATTLDIPSITACVCEAYVHYIERIGKRPRPMLDDFERVLRDSQVHVAQAQDGKVVGVIVMERTDEGFYVDNVAVRPAVKGTGVGRRLLGFAEAEAKRQGYSSLYLATHVLMTENQRLYTGIGYVKYDERIADGFPRFFYRKTIDT